MKGPTNVEPWSIDHSACVTFDLIIGFVWRTSNVDVQLSNIWLSILHMRDLWKSNSGPLITQYWSHWLVKPIKLLSISISPTSDSTWRMTNDDVQLLNACPIYPLQMVLSSSFDAYLKRMVNDERSTSITTKPTINRDSYSCTRSELLGVVGNRPHLF